MRNNGSLNADPVIQLVEHIYRGATDPQAWQGIVEHFTQFFSCTKGRLFTAVVPPERGGLGISCGVPEATLQEWGTRYIQHDIWMHVAIGKGLYVDGAAVLDIDYSG